MSVCVFKGVSRLQAEPRRGKSSSAEVSLGHDEVHLAVHPANGIFMSDTQPLSLLPRGGLMAKLMGAWPCSPKHYGTLTSPVTTETSIVAGSQRVTRGGIAGEELKERPVSCRGGSLNAPSSETMQLLPHLAPVTFPNPHLEKIFPLLIKFWESLLLYGARYRTGEKSQFCSRLSALNQRKHWLFFGNIGWFISFSHPE